MFSTDPTAIGCKLLSNASNGFVEFEICSHIALDELEVWTSGV